MRIVTTLFPLVALFLTGCIYIPYPRSDVLPREPLRRVMVVDAVTAAPVEGAKLTHYVFGYEKADHTMAGVHFARDQSFRGVGAAEKKDSRDPSVDRRVYKAVDDVFVLGSKRYFASGYILIFPWMTTHADHTFDSCVFAKAPGYETIAVGLSQVKPSVFEVGRVVSTNPVKFSGYWREPGSINYDGDGPPNEPMSESPAALSRWPTDRGDLTIIRLAKKERAVPERN